MFSHTEGVVAEVVRRPGRLAAIIMQAERAVPWCTPGRDEPTGMSRVGSEKRMLAG